MTTMTFIKTQKKKKNTLNFVDIKYQR